MTPVEKQRLVLLRLLKEQSLKEVPSEWQNKGENGAFGPSSQLCQIGTSTEGGAVQCCSQCPCSG